MLTPAQHEAQRRYRETHKEVLRAKAAIRNANRTKEQRAEDNRKWRERHPEEAKARNAAWREANKEHHRANAKHWQQENPERYRANQERWKDENRDYSGRYYHSTENRRLTVLLRACVHTALTRRASGRNWRADAQIGKLIACSKPALIAHIAAQFQPGMSWANYGRGGWEIDHIRPCASFDLTDPAQQAACFHYTNLRPLWRADNLSRPKRSN